jgi:glutamate---cysteine ligase / carboxylate-amine ligase
MPRDRPSIYGSSVPEDFTIGVEEEFQLVDAQTRALRPRAERILPAARAAVGDRVQSEFYRCMIEIGTPICHTLGDVRRELVRLRGEVIAAAGREGSCIAAAGTHPFSHWDEQRITPKGRYVAMEQDYQQLAREQIIFGCHVHIGIADRDAAIGVMNRARIFLPVLLALSANSPFWLASDTGYASFRTEIWRRWPTAGLPNTFASRAEYDALVTDLTATGLVPDGTTIYWDIRPSARYETLEFRIADVCATVDEAVMIAGLTRALAVTCYRQAFDALREPRPELLAVAKWQAARYGLGAELIDPYTGRPRPAREVIHTFLEVVRPALAERGEWDEVQHLVERTCARGGGAALQREAFRRGERFEDAVDAVVAATASH